ncbi:S9 family peptidase [Actinomadura xylanilytica]|uniref:S9 family peptidase n=1 Tax=Actinomadura xylanilytica TaxID=887459 RepID=UPI00255A8554|nr:prolyl oligopeptidase family serine peptidase [Actinomadura xylanilytica]MDL4770694.1 prolyl oligopeptidase family serine peptidase [Actinomadura xylanilytica]
MTSENTESRTVHEYPDFVPRQRFQPTLALSPDAQTVAYSSNAGGNFDLWVVPSAGGEARQVTRLTDQTVRRIAWAPAGKSLVFAADREGDEQYRLYRVGLDDETPTELAPGPDCQRVLAFDPFDESGRFLVYAANDRDLTVQDLLVRDLSDDVERRIVPPQGVIFEPAGISPDGRWVLTAGFRTNSDIAAYLVDLTDPDSTAVCVTAEHGRGLFIPGPWAPDSTGFYLRTDVWGEFTCAARYSLLEGALEPVAQHDWDVEHVDAAGETLLWSVNEGGRSILHARRRDADLAFPALPQGVITSVALAASGDLIVVLIDSATRPSEIGVLGPAAGFRYLTDATPAAFHVVDPVEPEVITYPASGGRQVPALFYRPRTPGPHPVLLSIHGGPERQERPVYVCSGLYQYLLAQGIAIFAPNIAGSTGYGITHQSLIHRDWGGIDLDDLGHALRHLHTDPGIDADRIAVMGGSYGGFAALSCLARLPHSWIAGVSLCGPTNLVTLARACPPTWKAYVAAVLGDPDADTAHLTENSPITHADVVSTPLFILQGARDPRVPKTESDHFVTRLRDRGVDARYDVYPDEGHGFTNRNNELKAYGDIAQFLSGHLSLNSAERP